MYKKILVPLDGSALAENALAPVIELAQCTQAQIVLLRVMLAPIYEYVVVDPMMAPILPEDAEPNRQEIRKYLESVAGGLREKGLRVTIQVCEGPVADAILDCAARIHADLIAMSTHGRSGVARWLLGSVADRVVQAADVPVLLVRPHVNKPE